MGTQTLYLDLVIVGLLAVPLDLHVLVCRLQTVARLTAVPLKSLEEGALKRYAGWSRLD